MYVSFNVPGNLAMLIMLVLIEPYLHIAMLPSLSHTRCNEL